jgi:hypothetical protein
MDDVSDILIFLAGVSGLCTIGALVTGDLSLALLGGAEFLFFGIWSVRYIRKLRKKNGKS